MATPGTAQHEGDPEGEKDRDTVELDSSALSRLRELDPEIHDHPGDLDAGIDRDTVEISIAESQSLAKKAEGPPSSPSASGEVQIPLPPRRSLAELEPDASDRVALHTIPSPPSFDDED
jgi:hypothetical protein